MTSVQDPHLYQRVDIKQFVLSTLDTCARPFSFLFPFPFSFPFLFPSFLVLPLPHSNYTERKNNACWFQNCFLLPDTSLGFGAITAEILKFRLGSIYCAESLVLA